ncbi:hypothetical protein WJ883_10740, partial [Coxiella burnetii]
ITVGIHLFNIIVCMSTETRIYTTSLFYGVIVMPLFTGFALGLT